MACAEPSWVSAVGERQLGGLLSLGALLSNKVLVSDVHLGDNKHFLDAFRRRDSRGLYARFRAFVEAGAVEVLLRRESLRPGTRFDVVECACFSDVYRAWQLQDDEAAWIVPPGGPERQAFFEDVDAWIPSSAVRRYSYGDIKLDFMTRVRTAATSLADPWFERALERLEPATRSGYEKIIVRDWFSLSDLYSYFLKSGIARSSPIVLAHGLLNEISYSSSVRSPLLGVDVFGAPLEDRFWSGTGPEHLESPVAPAVDHVEALLETAVDVIDAPSLSLLGLLTAEEIAQQRYESGRGYFDLLDLSSDPDYLRGNPDVGTRLAIAACDYWKHVCDYLRSKHPAAALTRTKLAVFLGNLPRPASTLSDRMYSFATNVGVPSAAALSDATASRARLVELAVGSALRFLYVAESAELRRLRALLPDRIWLTRQQPYVFGRS